MNELEDKLREIVKLIHNNCPYVEPCPVERHAIEAIKETFEAADYRRLPNESTIDKLVKEGLAEKLMTGAEWLARFEKELEEIYVDEEYSEDKVFLKDVKTAAKRVSCLSEE